MISISFFVIAGTDGSGKATQTELLRKNLHEMGKEVLVVDFPNYSSVYGKLIGRYLNNEFGPAHKVDPYLASVLYAEDRRLQKEKMLEALSQGKILLANRYVESNAAHQSIKLPEEKRKSFLDWLYNLEFTISGLPKPSRTFFLYLPYVFRKKLMEKRGDRGYINGLDGHEANINHQTAAEKQYLWLAEHDRWQVIKCEHEGSLRTKQEIAKELLSCVQDIL